MPAPTSTLLVSLLSLASLARSQFCTLTVPPNPLTAQGLATPYVLTGCNQLDFANQGCFVEAVIFDPATNTLQVYNPLVINAGMTPVPNVTASASTASALSSSSLITSSHVPTTMPTASSLTMAGSNMTSSVAKAGASSSSSATSSSHALSSSSSMSSSHVSMTMSTATTVSMATSMSSSGSPSMAMMSPSVALMSASAAIMGPAVVTAAPAASGVTSAPAASGVPLNTTSHFRRQTVPTTGFYIPPIVPTVPAGAVVGIWFGSNALTLTLAGDIGTCTNGLAGSVFGQFAYCNAVPWFQATYTAVQAGKLKLTPPGFANPTGQACPTTRDFRIVDQDQSDNVDTTYLLINGTILAQNTPANAKANPNAEELTNASDNALVNSFIDPALGCLPFSNPCTTCPLGKSPALATNELQAQFFPPMGGPALIPLNDDFVTIKNNNVITQSLDKTNLYRAGVGQTPAATLANASGTTYCQQFAQSGLFIINNMFNFMNKGSPVPAQANSLYTFLAMRFSMAFGPVPGLGCTTIFGVNNPVTMTLDGNGVAIAAVINIQTLEGIFSGLTKPVIQADPSLPVAAEAPVVVLPPDTGSTTHFRMRKVRKSA